MTQSGRGLAWAGGEKTKQNKTKERKSKTLRGRRDKKKTNKTKEKNPEIEDLAAVKTKVREIRRGYDLSSFSLRIM